MVKDQWEDVSNDQWEDIPVGNKLTNISLDQANKDIRIAQQATTPLALLDKTISGTSSDIINAVPRAAGNIINSGKNIVGGLVNSFGTVEGLSNTAKGVISAVKNPPNALHEYIKGRYDTLENTGKTITEDPLGTLLDISAVTGVAGGTLTKIGKANNTASVTNAGQKLTNISQAPFKAVGDASKQVLDNAIKPPSPEQLIAKAEDITYKLLRPSINDVANSLKKHEVYPAVREFTKAIRKSKDFGEAQVHIENATKTIFDERNSILKANNYKMTDNYIKGLEDFYNKKKSEGIMKEPELNQIGDVISQEKAWLAQNPEMDRLSGQSRKERLQQETKKLLITREDGGITVTEPARKQAMDILRDGLKKEVEGNDIRVRELNETYGGLKDAKDLITRQAAMIKTSASDGLIKRTMMFFANPRGTVVDNAIDNLNKLSVKTSKIEKLMQQAMKDKVAKVVSESILKERATPLGLPDLTPKYIKDRMKSDIPSLGVRGKPRILGIPGDEVIVSGN